MKLCVIAGSFLSDYQILGEEEDFLTDLVRTLQHTSVKFFGYGAGARVLARVLSHQISTNTKDNKLTFMGRKLISSPFGHRTFAL